MAEPIKWGVLGNANIARVCVIPAIQASGNGRVHALASRSPREASETVQRFEIPNLYPDYNALLEDTEIDAVYIPLPNHLHHPWTLRALAAGKHVLCEKPLACNAREAREMSDAAQSSARLLMEAFMYRFHPRSLRIREMVSDGSIGIPRSIHVAFCYAMQPADLENPQNPRMSPKMGGGALLDVGCYGVSLARWLLGSEPEQVQAQAEYHPGGADVHFTGLLRFPGGTSATVGAGFTSALQQTYAVVGSTSSIELPHDAFIPWDKDAAFTLRGKDEETGRQVVIDGADEYGLMVEHFADAVLGKTPPAHSPADSVANMQVLDALAQAARTGNTIRFQPAH